MAEVSINVEVQGVVNDTMKTLERKGMRLLADLLELSSVDDVTELIQDVDFSIRTEEYVPIQEGGITGRFPRYSAVLYVKLRNDSKGYYSGKLF